MRKKAKKYSFVQRKSLMKNAAEKVYVTYQEFKGAEMLRNFPENSFAIVLFDKGSGTDTISSTVFQVRPKQIHMQFPEQKQKWNLRAGAKGQRLIIRKELAETFAPKLQFVFSPYNHYHVMDLDVPAYHKVNAEFLAIKKELAFNSVFIELVNSRCRLIALMINLLLEDELGDKVTFAKGSIVYKFHSLIEGHYKTQKTVSFYAKHLCITPNYLNIVCKKQYKMSALEFIQERILLEAKRLLHSSDRSIKEIAFNLGFRNLSYFSFFFRAKTNLTPKEYKELSNES